MPSALRLNSAENSKHTISCTSLSRSSLRRPRRLRWPSQRENRTPEMNFLVPYCVLILISSGLAALVTPLIRSLALHIGAVDHPGVRKIHKTPTPCLGGVSVVLAGTLTVVAMLGLDQVLGRVIGLNPG